MPKTRHAGSPKYWKRDISWHFHSLQVRSSANFLLDMFFIYFCIFIAMNEVNSKHWKISRILINFSRRNSHFQGVSSAFEKKFQIPAFYKYFNDLHKPWNKGYRKEEEREVDAPTLCRACFYYTFIYNRASLLSFEKENFYPSLKE